MDPRLLSDSRSDSRVSRRALGQPRKVVDAMRRFFALVAALAVVLTSAGAANADTTGGCSGATQCRTIGSGVEASWYGVPLDGPVIGRIYTDTYVAASTSMT